jgi:hypothetical protein
MSTINFIAVCAAFYWARGLFGYQKVLFGLLWCLEERLALKKPGYVVASEMGYANQVARYRY